MHEQRGWGIIIIFSFSRFLTHDVSMLNRREFIGYTATSVFVSGVAPAILGAEDKSSTRPVIIGQGDFQFECDHRWGEVPDHITWKNTHGVAVDRSGFVYITHQGDTKKPCDTVVVFDEQGAFVRSFGKEFAGGGHGIDIRREGNEEFLYLCDIHNRQVVKCDTNGEWVWKIRYPREPDLYKSVTDFRPTNVCFAPNGDFFVADGYGSDFIHRYDTNGRWIQSWGGSGTQVGKFKTPHGIWLDRRNKNAPQIVIADRANARLQFFSLEGKPSSIIQGVGKERREQDSASLLAEDGSEISIKNALGMSFPADVDIWESMMVVPDLHAKVLLFDEENKVIANLGDDSTWTKAVLDDSTFRTDPSKWVNGKFIHPHDACFDIDGNIIVTEWVEPGRITKLNWL